jgi:tetratricopeptide (TPR) repeat protein
VGLVDVMSLEPDDSFISSSRTRRIEEAKRIRERAVKLLGAGKHSEAADAFVDYALSLSESGDVVGLECSLIEAAEALDAKKAFKDAAKLYLFVANSLRKAQLWGDAVNYYQKAAETYSSIGEKRFNAAAAACYVGAADCLAQLKLWGEAERMMTLGAIQGTGENIIELENQAREMFGTRNYVKASEICGRVASAYASSLDQLSDLLPKSGLGEIAIETKSILLHRSSECHVAETISLLKAGKIREAKKALSDAAVGFRVALMNLEPILLVGRPSPSDYRRFSYNLMMSSLLYKLLGEDDEVEAMFRMLISDKEKKVAEKLDTIQYFRVAEDMRKMKLTDAIEELRTVRLGNLENIKTELVEAFKSLSKK